MKKKNYMIGLKNASKGFSGELMQKIATGYEEYFRIELERGSKKAILPFKAAKFF